MSFLKFAIVLLSINNVFTLTKKPKNFQFGVATASYQIEGGWDADGKGENIWDRYTHTHKDQISDNSTGDIACDSYHLWQKDVALLDDLGVDFYRFSLSWSRILPGGFSNSINKKGVKYYNDLIDLLKSKNIEPMVTLYHWDLPQPIQDLGGWTNYLTSDYFAEFAQIAFSLFGDRYWITINDPLGICVDGYDKPINGAPGIKSPGIGTYICGKTVLLAHAKAYRLYETEFKNSQGGKVGITIDFDWAEPLSDSQADQDASEREMQMSFGWFADPIFSQEGDYPLALVNAVTTRSVKQNFTFSRLPPLSTEEISLIRGSADFLGLNHYLTWMVTAQSFSDNEISFDSDKGNILLNDPFWKDPDILPWSLKKLLLWIKERYNNPLVYITENGISDTTGTLNDTHRVNYIKEYVKAVYEAVNVKKCNVYS